MKEWTEAKYKGPELRKKEYEEEVGRKKHNSGGRPTDANIVW